MAEDKSLSEFTTTMVKEGAFNCSICKEVMETPIWVVEKVGNICNRCHGNRPAIQWLKKNKCVRNKTLETILKNLKLPCKYESYGCKDILGYGKRSQHEIQCPYSPKLCPLKDLEDCPWMGSLMSVIRHFEDAHQRHVIVCDCNAFNVQIKSKGITQMVKLMISNSDKYYLKASCNVLSGKLRLMVCLSAGSSAETLGKYVLEIGCDTKETVSVKKRESIQPVEKVYECIYNTELSLDTLKSLMGNFNIINVKIKIVDDLPTEIREQVLSNLECPVCNYFVKPPILMCLSGHITCNYCRLRLKKCPVCRRKFSNTRNYPLEGIAVGIQYPCRNTGCEDRIYLNETEKHERLCKFRLYACPFYNDCKKDLNDAELVEHLKLHPNRVLYKDNLVYTIDLDVVDYLNEHYCLVVLDEVFRVNFIYEKICLDVQVLVIGSRSYIRYKEFEYELSIILLGHTEKAWKYSCTSMEPPPEEKKEHVGVRLDKTMIENGKVCGKFCFQVRVFKKE